ncbi:MAG: hypothetical protein WBR18_11645 [Anaerolineales bacterium]
MCESPLAWGQGAGALTVSANFETAAWCALALAAWPLSYWLGPRLRAALGDRADAVMMWAPWLHGLGPMYLAWISGALPASYLGLLGLNGAVGWLASAILAAGLWFGARWFVRERNLQAPAYPLDWAVLDEPRWALYRAAGWLWTMDRGIGLLIGLALGVLEWGLRHRLWKTENRTSPSACLTLARLASSSLIFALTGNIWLTIVFQVALLQLLMPSPREQGAS